MNKEQLAALRAEVRKAHKAANQKVSRLRTAKGIELAGTRSDPRRDLAAIRGYTAKQLNTYLSELNTFRSRQTSFHMGATGETVTGEKWREYKALERKHNRRAARANERVRNVKLPGQSMTIGERDATTRPQGPRAFSGGRPMDKVSRSKSGIVSERSLSKLIRDMRKRTGKTYEADTLAKQRRVALRMSKGKGNRKQRERLRGLTDRQFDLLWNYTEFPTLMSTKYHTNPDSQSKFVAQTRETAEDDIDEYLTWATQQGKPVPKNRKRR